MTDEVVERHNEESLYSSIPVADKHVVLWERKGYGERGGLRVPYSLILNVEVCSTLPSTVIQVLTNNCSKHAEHLGESIHAFKIVTLWELSTRFFRVSFQSHHCGLPMQHLVCLTVPCSLYVRKRFYPFIYRVRIRFVIIPQ